MATKKIEIYLIISSFFVKTLKLQSIQWKCSLYAISLHKVSLQSSYVPNLLTKMSILLVETQFIEQFNSSNKIVRVIWMMTCKQVLLTKTLIETLNLCTKGYTAKATFEQFHSRNLKFSFSNENISSPLGPSLSRHFISLNFTESTSPLIIIKGLKKKNNSRLEIW